MANPEHLEEQREETRLIIEELLEDGSDPDALYTIEHHLSADDFETLEKVAVEAFKLGYEVTEPEELEVEEGDMRYSERMRAERRPDRCPGGTADDAGRKI